MCTAKCPKMQRRLPFLCWQQRRGGCCAPLQFLPFLNTKTRTPPDSCKCQKGLLWRSRARFCRFFALVVYVHFIGHCGQPVVGKNANVVATPRFPQIPNSFGVASLRVCQNNGVVFKLGLFWFKPFFAYQNFEAARLAPAF